MADGRDIQSFMDWLYHGEAKTEAELADAAEGAAVAIYVSGSFFCLQGSFPDPISAMAYAQKYEEESKRLNLGEVTTSVVPLHAPDLCDHEDKKLVGEKTISVFQCADCSSTVEA